MGDSSGDLPDIGDNRWEGYILGMDEMGKETRPIKGVGYGQIRTQGGNKI